MFKILSYFHSNPYLKIIKMKVSHPSIISSQSTPSDMQLHSQYGIEQALITFNTMIFYH